MSDQFLLKINAVKLEIQATVLVNQAVLVAVAIRSAIAVVRHGLITASSTTGDFLGDVYDQIAQCHSNSICQMNSTSQIYFGDCFCILL